MPPVGQALSVSIDDRKVRRMLASYEGPAMRTRLRRGTRVAAGVYRAAIRARARSASNVPDFFARTRTKHSARIGRDITSQTGPASPLWHIFEGGADSHEITSAPRRALGGPAGQRWRKRAFSASGRVRHPGMSARPIVEPAFTAASPAAKRAAATSIFGDQAVSLLGLGE